MTEYLAAERFLNNARRTLVDARLVYGSRSREYRHLLRDFRHIADALGCRRELERSLHRLRRGRLGRTAAHRWHAG